MTEHRWTAEDVAAYYARHGWKNPYEEDTAASPGEAIQAQGVKRHPKAAASILGHPERSQRNAQAMASEKESSGMSACIMQRDAIMQPSPATVTRWALRFCQLRTVSESNQCEHWTRHARRTHYQRTLVFNKLALHGSWPAPLPPLNIRLIRIAPRALDDDNLCGALKAIRDGVADYLAGAYLAGDDRQEGIAWTYAQTRGEPREYSVEIQITRAEEEVLPWPLM